MAENFNTLLTRMDPERRERVEKRVAEEMERMVLQELRQARHLTQEQIASALGIKQAGVSRIESQTDMYISTLRRFVEAMGGELQIVATFPDGEVAISQFAERADDERSDPAA
jgi:transcriptional regulator with XRE-family HTH domain